MSVLTLAEAKRHLNIDASNTTDDVELQAVIDAAEAVIARRVGPLTVTTVTSRVQGDTNILVLPVTPVVSITGVTPVGGVGLGVSDLDFTGGLITYTSGYGRFPTARYDVTYTAGRSTVPTDLLMGIKEMVRHLWSTQRSSGRPTGQTAPGVPAFLVPYAVAELIAPYVQSGFA